MRTQSCVIGCLAICEDCDVRYELYTTAQRQGRAHHLKTGHTVSIELVTTYQFTKEQQ